MHYVLYVDSLFFLNFIMNLYLLALVNRSALHTARPVRLVAGAAVGAAAFILPFAGGLPMAIRLAAGFLAGTAGMIYVSFPVKSFRMFLKLLERLALYSFGLGGLMLFLVRSLPFVGRDINGVLGMLGVGGLGFLLFARLPLGLKRSDGLCRATLCRNGVKMTVEALVDSGNSLFEPVSGKPVSVVDRELFRGLWGEAEAEVFRAVPYHSIGKRRGILRGYPLQGLLLEIDGVGRTFNDVYIAVSDEVISHAEGVGAKSIKMIIHPALLEDGAGAAQKRQNVRHNNDTESDVTRQNTVQAHTQGQFTAAQKR